MKTIAQSILLVVLPFGTALGIYSLWALLHRGSRLLFLREQG